MMITPEVERQRNRNKFLTVQGTGVIPRSMAKAQTVNVLTCGINKNRSTYTCMAREERRSKLQLRQGSFSKHKTPTKIAVAPEVWMEVNRQHTSTADVNPPFHIATEVTQGHTAIAYRKGRKRISRPI